MTTQELIKLDKQQAKLRAFRIDSMPVDECRHMLREICRQLNIEIVEDLVRSLQSIAKAIALIPQMEHYIETVDVIVWSPAKLLQQFLDGAQISHPSAAPHKLSETSETLKEWRRLIEHDLKQLRTFRQSVFDALNLQLSNSDHQNSVSDRFCLQELKRLVQGDNGDNSRKHDDPFESLLNLFNISDRNRAQAIGNELFLFVTETNRWLTKFRPLLEERGSSPAKSSAEDVKSLEPPSKTLGRLWQLLANRSLTDNLEPLSSSAKSSAESTAIGGKLRKTVGSSTDVTMSSLDALLGKVSQVETDWQKEIGQSKAGGLVSIEEDRRSFRGRWTAVDDSDQNDDVDLMNANANPLSGEHAAVGIAEQ